jgi:hypothetical protein
MLHENSNTRYPVFLGKLKWQHLWRSISESDPVNPFWRRYAAKQCGWDICASCMRMTGDGHRYANANFRAAYLSQLWACFSNKRSKRDSYNY